MIGDPVCGEIGRVLEFKIPYKKLTYDSRTPPVRLRFSPSDRVACEKDVTFF